MHDQTKDITDVILKAAAKARSETSAEPEPELTRAIDWPVQCSVGPGLEGAIACESKVGYVNGSKGALIYRGYDIFDLAAHSNFEETSYLLLNGKLPTPRQFETFKEKLISHRSVPKTLRILMNFPIEEMNTMAALRIGTNMMRQEFTYVDQDQAKHKPTDAIQADEDSIPMETPPKGEEKAIYEFRKGEGRKPRPPKTDLEGAAEYESAIHLVAGVATLAAAIARIRMGKMPIDPRDDLSHAANFLYMITGKEPTPEEERIMDVCLILHADHGMNASTFASMVVASTLSDIYFAVGSGVAALNGPLHGGANEQVIHTLEEIGQPKKVTAWFEKARSRKQKIMGFGHRVYKAYDPRARVLGPLAEKMSSTHKDAAHLLKIATRLEKEAVKALGSKGIWPNVDFYSGIVYKCMGIPTEMFTPIFAVSRVSGWTARILEYLQHNRIFRPRAMYTGHFNKEIVELDKRGRSGKKKT